MWDFINRHEFWAAVVSYWIVSAAVSSMPAPLPLGSPGYQWLYNFLHTVVGNLDKTFGSKIPGGTIKVILFFVLLVPVLAIAPASCAHQARTSHPGAVSVADSSAYDALLVADAVIDQARKEYEAGKLPVSSKPILETLIQTYNVARASWLTYRGAVSSKEDPVVYLDAMTKNLAELTSALKAFNEVSR